MPRRRSILRREAKEAREIARRLEAWFDRNEESFQRAGVGEAYAGGRRGAEEFAQALRGLADLLDDGTSP